MTIKSTVPDSLIERFIGQGRVHPKGTFYGGIEAMRGLSENQKMILRLIDGLVVRQSKGINYTPRNKRTMTWAEMTSEDYAFAERIIEENAENLHQLGIELNYLGGTHIQLFRGDGNDVIDLMQDSLEIVKALAECEEVRSEPVRI